MRSQTDDISADERLTAIAAIFAEALLRLKSRRIQTSPDSGNSSHEGIEVRRPTVLSVHTGLLPRLS